MPRGLLLLVAAVGLLCAGGSGGGGVEGGEVVHPHNLGHHRHHHPGGGGGGMQQLQRRPRPVNATAEKERLIKKLLRQTAIPAPHYLDEEEPVPLPPPRKRPNGSQVGQKKPTEPIDGTNDKAAFVLPFPLPQPVRRPANASGAASVGVPSGVRRFIILTTQRSGSGWLLHKLASRYPHVRADPSEPFIGVKHAFTAEEYNAMGETNFRYFLDRTLLRRCGMKEWQPRELACGFKFMYNQMPTGVPDVALLEWAAANDVAVIHLVRQNILRNLISKALLSRDQDEHQGNAHVRKTDPQLNPEVALPTAAAAAALAAAGGGGGGGGTAAAGGGGDKPVVLYNNSRAIRLPYPGNATWDAATALERFSSRVRFDLRDISNWRRLLLEHRAGAHIEVSYEALMASDAQCSAALAFLHPALARFSCQDVEAENGIQKQHTGKTCAAYVENWEDIRSTVQELSKESDLRPMLLYALRSCNNKE